MENKKVILDAMGGDNAPVETVKGVVQALEENPAMNLLLVGVEEDIRAELAKYKYPAEKIDIRHASEIITMEDSPKKAVDEKTDASINVACKLLQDGKGDALVSAGNTGATVIACAKSLDRITGVERGALAAVLPAAKKEKTHPGRTVMLDVGATLNCSPPQLVQFALMGIHYMREVFNVETPRLGLLNIGEEETKGHDGLVETYSLLKKLDNANFIGNVEGKDVLRGVADVIVTEGMIGNIVLKALEGVAEMGIETGKKIWKKSLMAKIGLTMMAPKLKKLKRNLDYSEYGGAPILGFEKLVIKSHGRSNAKAIKNALLNAEVSLEHNLVANIQADIKKYSQMLFSEYEQDLIDKIY